MSASGGATWSARCTTGPCARARSSTSEPPDTNAQEAGRWLAQARDELSAARRVANDPEVVPRIACFLAHLAGEKALKACLIAVGQPLRKLHDLIELRERLPPEQGSGFDGPDLQILNTWLVQGRYPADLDEATRTEAHECVAAAARVVAWSETVVLGEGGIRR